VKCFTQLDTPKKIHLTTKRCNKAETKVRTKVITRRRACALYKYTSRFEEPAGFLKLLMKGILNPYINTVTFWQKVDFLISNTD
jgi:hypothetical protein